MEEYDKAKVLGRVGEKVEETNFRNGIETGIETNRGPLTIS